MERVTAEDGGDTAPEPVKTAEAPGLGRGRGGDDVGEEMVFRGSGDSLLQSGCFAGAADSASWSISSLALFSGRSWAALAGRDDSGGRRSRGGDEGGWGLAGLVGSGRCCLLLFCTV